MKELDSYVFTAEANHYRQLDLVAITRDVNKVMRDLANPILLVTASGLASSPSYGKIPKISSLSNKPWVIEN